MTQTNEQLINQAEKLTGRLSLAFEIRQVIRALLEENKLLRESKLDVEHNRSLLSAELQQTREELAEQHEISHNMHTMANGYLAELERVKSEYELFKIMETDNYHSMKNEIEAKDKVLEWYAAEDGDPTIYGVKARSILSKYSRRHQ